MTLLQTVFSAERIIQVSDRRLTLNGEVFDDGYTKLVCWNQTFTVGFTGIARIDRRARQSTSEWIATILCDYPAFLPGVQALRQEAESRVSKLPWTDKRLAIVVAGFDFHQVPLVAEIANFNTATNKNEDPNIFRLRYAQVPPGRTAHTHSVGALLSDLEGRLLSRYVPRILRKDKLNGHNRAIKVLVDNQRRVHRRDSMVGADAQAVTIPCSQMGHGILMSNLDGTDIPAHSSSFVYFDRKGFRYKQFGPLMAQGGQVIDQVIGTADEDNPDNQTMSIRFVKVPTPPTRAQRRAGGR